MKKIKKNRILAGRKRVFVVGFRVVKSYFKSIHEQNHHHKMLA